MGRNPSLLAMQVRFAHLLHSQGDKILPIPETMQGISTSPDSKEERSKKIV